MDREKIDGWDEIILTQILTEYILVFESITFATESQIWWFKMIQKADLQGYNSYGDHYF